MAGFEWDEDKNAQNRAKHGISFEEAATIFEGPVLTKFDETHYSEVREVSFGLLGGIIVACVVHTERDGRIRIISARKATPRERKLCDAYIKKAFN